MLRCLSGSNKRDASPVMPQQPSEHVSETDLFRDFDLPFQRRDVFGLGTFKRFFCFPVADSCGVGK